jgi:hypothetical protein
VSGSARTAGTSFRHPAERLLAWFFTGPVGHFVAGSADWAGLLVRYAWARARGRSLF